MIPRHDPLVLLLTGPGGAGKTSTAEAWATVCPQPAAHLSLDDVRHFLKSGYANPPAGWSDEVRKQHALARHLCAYMASRYVDAGITCVIDDVVFPDPETVVKAGDAAALEAFPEWETVTYARWEEDLGGTPRALVVLLPSLDRVQERNAPRSEPHRLTPRFVSWMHRTMVPWRFQSEFQVIDNTDLTLDQTVAAVNQALGWES